jgi:hypothetical protein
MRITFADVQRNVTDIANREAYTVDVLFELMAAYGRSAASITKLRKGTIDVSEVNNAFLQRGVVYFKHLESYKSLPAEVEKLEKDSLTARYNPRFIIATNLNRFAAKDLKKGNSLEIDWKDIDRHADFFFGWTGDEVTDEKTEALADKRVADKMQELYNEIELVNKDRLKNKKSKFRHNLNVFFSRLLFCFFAEDTKVFSRNTTSIFTDSVKDFTQLDGSDLDIFLNRLFEALDTKDKSNFGSPYSKFPYVNGNLFNKNFGVDIPKFNAQARKLIIDCGSLNWAEINPDIFGSMFQSIVDEEMRSTHGMHYTSVPNILKTIEPLFLNELRSEFENNFDNKKKLKNLWDRIAKIKVFDPACGSGNFLIIAYKELRKLEHSIVERLLDKEYEREVFAGKITSRIDLDNFYGIEIDDFACEVATLSLYLAKHQMNIEFEKQFGKRIELIPLTDKADIEHGNAARIDWQKVCPNKPIDSANLSGKQQSLISPESEQMELEIGNIKWEEIYLVSNPPYLGSRNQDSTQKEDLKLITSNYKSLDYISLWFIKGAEYIYNTRAKLAFVSTNSICQGEQVAILWANILKKVEIGFAFTSFKWINNAKHNAGVVCVVISLRNMSDETKYIYSDGIKTKVDNINAYLTQSKNIYIFRRSQPLSKLPAATYGSMPNDKGNLVLDYKEKDELTSKIPNIKKYIMRFTGSAQFLKGLKRWCLVIPDEDVIKLRNYQEINKRLDSITTHRKQSSEKSTQNIANKPNQFYFWSHKSGKSIIIPRVSSERREYIPIGFLDDITVISDSAIAIYDAEPWIFSILSSKMHMSWVCAVAGRLKTDYRYSSTIVYNNFPLKELTSTQKEKINNSALSILFVRENHSEKSISEMYDPDKMPIDLKDALHKNDVLIDSLYRKKPYESDKERLSDLFKLYEEMIEKEKHE